MEKAYFCINGWLKSDEIRLIGFFGFVSDLVKKWLLYFNSFVKFSRCACLSFQSCYLLNTSQAFFGYLFEGEKESWVCFKV